MFRTVTLRPHWFQYIINETGSLCLLVASIWIYKFCSFAYHEWAIYACILLLFHLLFKLVYLARMEYQIYPDSQMDSATVQMALILNRTSSR